MKEGWGYKKLGEVATIINGKNQKAVEDESGIYPICGSGGTMGYANDFLCPEQTVIIGRKGNINRPIYMEQKFWNVDTAFGIVANRTQLVPKYLYYFCIDFNFEKLNKAVTIPSLVKSDLLKIEMAVPPLSEQQHIVEELDLLSSIIEKKKVQLNELDNLAQSLFYEMFGDPITNDKGWEVRKLNDIYKLKSGDGLSAKNFVEGIYPVYGGNGISGYHNAYNMNGDFIIIGRVGAYCGNVRYVKGLFWLTDNAFQLFFDANIQTPVFVLYLLTLLDLHRFANEAAQPVISNKTLRDLDIIIPTMEMQKLFASKIETIEHQKELIRKSIKEVETLYNSRMDFWFN